MKMVELFERTITLFNFICTTKMIYLNVVHFVIFDMPRPRKPQAVRLLWPNSGSSEHSSGRNQYTLLCSVSM